MVEWGCKRRAWYSDFVYRQGEASEGRACTPAARTISKRGQGTGDPSCWLRDIRGGKDTEEICRTSQD
jgi:hypothetical protein